MLIILKRIPQRFTERSKANSLKIVVIKASLFTIINQI